MKKFLSSIFAIALLMIVCNGPAKATVSAQSQQKVQPSTTIPKNNIFVTLHGKRVCLQHKNTSGPQTQECAIGFQDTSGNYYGIRYLPRPDWNGTTLSGIFIADTSGPYTEVGYIIYKTSP